MIVLDASAAVELLLGGDRGDRVLPLLEREEGAIHAPGLLDLEVAQVFRRMVAMGVVESPRGRASLEILEGLGVHRHPERPLLPRIWALKDNLTAYDAAYVALAEALACPLVTFDARIARTPGVSVEIVVLGG